MAIPTQKHPQIEHFLNDLFGRTSAIEADVCVCCGYAAFKFRDQISEKEYRISGLCQRCQDDIFEVT